VFLAVENLMEVFSGENVSVLRHKGRWLVFYFEFYGFEVLLTQAVFVLDQQLLQVLSL